MPLVLDAAQKHGIEVAIHLEPYEGRSLETIRWDIDYILDKYGDHPALYRRRKKIDRTNVTKENQLLKHLCAMFY